MTPHVIVDLFLTGLPHAKDAEMAQKSLRVLDPDPVLFVQLLGVELGRILALAPVQDVREGLQRNLSPASRSFQRIMEAAGKIVAPFVGMNFPGQRPIRILGLF